MAVLNTSPYLKYILHASLKPNAPREDVIYAVISEFISEHKIPSDRFVIYPQISLRWKPDKPKDDREEVPDFGICNFTHQSPFFKIRVGAEAKRSLPVMENLPAPHTIEADRDVLKALHGLYYQGEDQAKAAVKGEQTLMADIPWLLFVGPYWASVVYGPFSADQLTVRTHKPSDSADFLETMRAKLRFEQPPVQRHLFLLGTDESAAELERIFTHTDPMVDGWRNEAAVYDCTCLILLLIFSFSNAACRIYTSAAIASLGQ
jgi:hypothetical protein